MEKRLTLLVLAFFLFGVASGSVFPPQGEEPLAIYPNPAKDYLKIELRSDNLSAPILHIIDLTGKVVKKFNSSFSRDNEMFKAEVDISDLKTGIYFVKVIQEKQVSSLKLIVN